MVKNKKRLHLLPRPKRLTSVVLILIVVTGVMSGMFAGISVDLRSRDYLKGRAQTIANALPTKSISFLEGQENDTQKFEYKELKTQLERIQGDNRDLSYVYLMAMKHDKVVFLVDAASPASENFSPPGEEYTEASSRLRGGFFADAPFIEGPSRDRWGVWISALAPVIDPATNQTIALVGIDTPAANYYFDVLIYAMVPLCLAAIPLAGLLRDRKLQVKEWEITQLKNQFVSIASHELRSPLNGMVWAIQTLIKSGDGNMTDKQKLLLNDMFKSAESSTATINEILDLSVFERSKSTTKDFDTVDITTAIHEVQKTLTLGAQEKNVTIALDKTIPLAATTFGDINALKRAFMNLVSNSIKYCYEGSTIKIGYRTENNEHIFSVQDHGIGIPKDEQTKVLDGYYRAKNAAQTQVHGTGLGLWVSRLVIEEHGGRLWLQSTEKVGTTVYVSLPKTGAFTKV